MTRRIYVNVASLDQSRHEMDSTQRLHDAIAAVCPILGVSIGTPGQSATCEISYDPSATSDQQTAAQAALAAFDWSAGAQSAWEAQQATVQAGRALETSIAPSDVASRANAVCAYTRDNDVAEFAWAALQCVCSVLGVTAPTAAQIAAQIAANRVTNPVDSGATTPADVSTTGNVRLNQTQILALIAGVLGAGGGLPGN